MKRSLIAAALSLVAFSALTSPADARRHPPATAPLICNGTADVMRPCSIDANFLRGVRSIRVKMHRVRAAAEPATVVAHPPGCPSRAFCGCGAAVRVFGAPIRSLWLAAAWFKFPRTSPAAGMVAVRRHHVFVLERHLGGNTWIAYDANSGRHQTRIHARSIAGYTIVNPRA